MGSPPGNQAEVQRVCLGIPRGKRQEPAGNPAAGNRSRDCVADYSVNRGSG